MAVFILVSILTETLTWLHLLAVAMVQGALWSLVAPARQALIPQLVGRERLSSALPLIAAGMSVAALVSPAIAGLLYALTGPEGVYYTVTATGILAVVLTTSISARRVAEPRTSRGKTAMLRDVVEGVLYLWHNKLVRLLIGISFVFVFLSHPFQAMLPVFVVDVYHRETGALGLLVSMMGLGTLTGTVLIAWLGERRRGLLMMVAGLVSGTALGV